MARHRFTIEVETNEQFLKGCLTYPEDPSEWELEDVASALFLSGRGRAPIRKAELVDYSALEAAPV